MEAAESGDVELVRSLLGSTAEINGVDKHGETALMMAAAMGHIDVVRVLIANGDSVGMTTPYGWNALRFAKELGHGEVARLLETFSPTDEAVASVDRIGSDLDLKRRQPTIGFGRHQRGLSRS